MSSITELAYGAGWSVVKALPRSVAWRLFQAGADRAARKGGRGTQRLRQNLRQVVGPDMSEAEMDLLVRDGLRSYARYWLDAFRLPTFRPHQVLRDFQMQDEDKLAEAVAAGNGCVIALSHSGNWDYAGAWVCAHGWKLTTVAERLRPEGLYQKFVDYRASLGMEIIPATGGERPPLDLLLERIGEGRVIPLLAERDLSARGIDVQFFGAHTRMPAGPAVLALRTGAPLFVVWLWYDNGAPRGRVVGPVAPPPLDEGSMDVRVRLLTQRLADLLAEGIAAHPQDWHMLQRMWLTDEEPR
jgi:KDO2-lipid IV(A) lauroyltransferase